MCHESFVVGRSYGGLPFLKVLRGALIAAVAGFVSFAASATVYRPGLLQAKFRNNPSGKNRAPTFETNLLSKVSAESLDRTLDTMMANFRAPDSSSFCTNPLSGIPWNWNEYATFAYEGEMWLEAGVDYKMFEQGDDGSAVLIDGEEVVSAGTTSSWNSGKTGSLTPTETGWHRINVYTWDWDGNKGPQPGCWGLCWNTNGVTKSSGMIEANTSPWNLFADPGDMSLLRTVTGEETLFALDGKSDSGDTYSVGVTVLATNALVATVFYGDSDAGCRAAGWPRSAVFELPAGCGSTNLVFVSEYITQMFCRVCVSGSDAAGPYEEWSDAVKFSTVPEVTLNGGEAGFSTATVTGRVLSFGAGYDAVGVSLIRATDPEFTEQVVTTAVTTAFSDLNANLVVDLSGLAPATTYYARLRVVNAGGFTEFSQPVEFTTLSRPYTYIEPIVFSHIGGTPSVFVEVSGVYDGATVTVALSVNNEQVKTWSVTGPEICSYSDAALSSNDAITFTFSSTVAGETYTDEIVYVKSIYVATDGDDASSGSTPTNPKRTIANALASVDEGIERILVKPGEYQITEPLMVTSPVVLRGIGGSPSDVVITNSSGLSRVMVISNALATVSTVTLTGGADDGAGGVYLYAGLLTNSVVTGNQTTRSAGGGMVLANSGDAVVMDCSVSYNISNARVHGGGIYCSGRNAKVYRTKIIGNRIGSNYHSGGGVYGTTLYDCEIRENVKDYGCDDGGGAANATLYRCSIVSNLCCSAGGGLSKCTAYDCLIQGNRAITPGGAQVGGVSGGTLYNCTIVGNRLPTKESTGVKDATLWNCIVADNMTEDGSITNNYSGGTFYYTCVTPLPTAGEGNTDADPCFADAANGDWTLGAGSPCVNAGVSNDSEKFPAAELRSVDLNGDARIFGREVDLGCFECQTGGGTWIIVR